MNRLERDLARQMAETPIYDPPAGLLARLQAEIPSGVEAAGAEPHLGLAGRRPARWLAAAAAAFTVIGAGWLVWRVEAPPPLLETAGRFPVGHAEHAELSAPVPEGAEPRDFARREQPAPPPPAVPSPAPRENRMAPPPESPPPAGVAGGVAPGALPEIANETAAPPPPAPKAPGVLTGELPEKVEREERKTLQTLDLRRQDAEKDEVAPRPQAAAAAPEPLRARALRHCPLHLAITLPPSREAEAWLELDPAVVARWRREGSEAWTDAATAGPASLGDASAERRVELRYELELLPDPPSGRGPGQLRWRYFPAGSAAGGALVESTQPLSCTP